MAEVVGTLIIASIEAAGATGIAGASLAATTVFGVNLTTIVGTAAILGATIGLQYALRPDTPRPSDGSAPVKQAVPPRIMGYGRNRLAGFYMLFEEFSATSFDVMAFHSGRIGGIVQYFLHDDEVFLYDDGTVQAGFDNRYTPPSVAIETRLGYDDQAPPSWIGFTSGVWTAAHKGNGIAWAALRCGSTEMETFSSIYPRGLPTLSVVADCAPIWDPRDLAQSRFNPATWKVSFNPVIQLIDYLTRKDGGLGLDFDILFPPERLAEWMTEAYLCDEAVPKADGSTEPRYRSSGWFYFDNKPEDVINNILATCDGWMAEAGDGTLALTVGVYREPDVTITEKHIFGFSLNYGQADEQTVNQLDISYTDPDQQYVEVQGEPIRDEQSISDYGTVRSQQLNLKWTHSNSQAQRLGSRSLQRVNADMTGTFSTSLYGLKAVGKRWVRLQYPFVSGLQDCVVEIQSGEIDLMAGRCTFEFIRIAPDDIEAYDPEADEGQAPVVPPNPGADTGAYRREDGSILRREDSSSLRRETA